MSPLPLPARYALLESRLALGLELLDAPRGLRVAHGVEVALEGGPAPAPAPHSSADLAWGLPRLPRHRSALFALVWQPRQRSPLVVRVFDRERRYVPRRLAIPLPDLTLTPEPTLAERSRTIALFPGAAYDAPESATSVRGRVVRRAVPVPWARVEARRHGTTDVIARAQGDDRGEFFLLLPASCTPGGDLPVPPATVTVDLRIYAPAVPGSVPWPGAGDALADLPLETVPAPGAVDDVSTGAHIPGGYTVQKDFSPGVVPGAMLSADFDPYP